MDRWAECLIKVGKVGKESKGSVERDFLVVRSIYFTYHETISALSLFSIPLNPFARTGLLDGSNVAIRL
jgi:hypothetical protein